MKILNIVPLKDFEKYPSLKNRKIFQLLKEQNWKSIKK
jgi:hypothetical protein